MGTSFGAFVELLDDLSKAGVVQAPEALELAQLLSQEGCEKRFSLRGDFREGDEDSNLSILRVWRFTGSPESLH